MPTARTWLAFGAQLALTVVMAHELLADRAMSVGRLVWVAGLAFAGVCLLGASVTAHALARGITGGLVAIAAIALCYRFELAPAIVAALGVAILVLSAPAYERAAEISGFRPRAGRRALLAGVTASTALGLELTPLAFDYAELTGSASSASAVLVGAVGVGLLVSAVLVLRMRAVGIAVAVGTAVLALGGELALPVLDGADGSALALALALGLVAALSLPAAVLWARHVD